MPRSLGLLAPLLVAAALCAVWLVRRSGDLGPTQGGSARADAAATPPAGTDAADRVEPAVLAEAAGERLRFPAEGAAEAPATPPRTDVAGLTAPGDDASGDPGEIPVEGRSEVEWLEDFGLAPDTPLALRLGRDGPPDPVELGAASLSVRLVDAVSGEPKSMDVVLWRLDAPPNRFWQAGDQDVARAYLRGSGHTFEQLARGRYRLLVLDEWVGAPEHAAVEVRGHQEVCLEVRAPRDRPVRLELRGVAGGSTTLEVSLRSPVAVPRLDVVPAWVTMRVPQPEFRQLPFHFEQSFDELEDPRSWHAVLPLEGLYDLGRLPEDTRGARMRRRVAVRRPGGRERELLLTNPDAEPVRQGALRVVVDLDGETAQD